MDTMRARRSDTDISNDMLKSMSKSYHTPSMVALAMKYESGTGFKRNGNAALSLLQKASVAGGNPRTRLAERYLECDDGRRDEAFNLLKSAADYGDGAAMYRLALMYKDGIGCEADDGKYRWYMRMAAERGNRDAKELVAKWDDRIRRRKQNKEGKA